MAAICHNRGPLWYNGKYNTMKKRYQTLWKPCTACGIVKAFFEFHGDNSTRDGLNYVCKECNSARAKEYYDENKEKMRASAARRYHSDIDSSRKYYRRKARQWLKENRSKNRARSARKNAEKLKRTPAWADMESVNFFYECCPDGCHVDHIIPLRGKTVSGLHIETNLQWLPAEENLRKSNKF